MFKKEKGIALVQILIVGTLLLGLGIFVYKYNLISNNKTTTIAKPLNESTPSSTENSVIKKDTAPTPSPVDKVVVNTIQSPSPSPSPVSKPELSASFVLDGSEYRIFASWKNVSNPTSKDWLGVFQYGQETDSPIGFKVYTVSCAKVDQSDFSKPGITSGSCPMYMKLDNGTYEVRLYSNDSFLRIATSGKVTLIKP